MAQITRSTKIGGGTTLQANTLARAADIETDMLTLVNAHNNHDTGISQWTVVNGALVEAGNGLAGTPSLTFVNDPDTGLYRDAANTVGISAGGTKRMSVSDTAAAITVPTTLSGLLTMSGAGIAMGTQAITNVANGAAAQDVPSFKQVKALQVIQATFTSNSSITSSSFSDTGLTASITPTNASNKILVLMSGDWSISTAGVNAFLTIKRGSTNIGAAGGGFASLFHNGTAGTHRCPVSVVYLDSPAATTSTTYTVQIKNSDGAATVLFPSGNLPQANLVLIEINGL